MTLLAWSACAAASAQEFAAFSSQIASIRDQAQAQKQIVQRPKVMGAAGRFSAESLTPEATVAPDVSAYPVRGMDISHYNGAIDWDKVSKDGLSFVYIKATEGETLADDDFTANWQGASSAGLLKGAYHFYDFCDAGAPQADNFIKTVPVEAGALPATIDLEESSDCKTMPAKAVFRADLAAFVQKIEDAYGKTPVLYVNASIYTKYFLGENDSYKLWIADISHASPAMPGDAPWAMWQYNWHANVAGVGSEVDLDVFNGTPQQLASLAQDPDSGVVVAALR
jgi:lysozyme